jgi:hypothetical protein
MSETAGGQLWTLSGTFCPFCAANFAVYEGNSEDYYMGCTYLCVQCGARYYMPDSGDANKPDDPSYKALIELRAALAQSVS